MKFAHARDIAVASVVVMLVLVPAASAQTPAPEPAAVQTVESDEVPSVGGVLIGTVRNFGRLPARSTAAWLSGAVVAAIATHPLDSYATRTLGGSDALHEPLEPGAVIGGTPFALGASIATYGIGRAINKPRVARLGADLIQAQLMAEALAFAGKQIVRRARPEGSGYSFPSGHAAVTFASADVLQRTFGWKAGAPAYAVATYVAASRIQGRNHFLSDVVFGAALGTIAGRTVPITRSHRLAISPMVSADRAGVMFALQHADAPGTR